MELALNAKNDLLTTVIYGLLATILMVSFI